MSIDQLVSRDLATTAAANRVPPRTLEHTLQSVGARPVPAAPSTTGSVMRWLVLGDVYASRIARTAAGLAALAALVMMFAVNAAKTIHLLDYNSRWFGGAPVPVGVFVLAAILLVRIAARGWASRAFTRAAASPGLAERMLAASDRRALVVTIAGPFAFSLVFGVAYFVLRTDPLDYFACALDRSCWGEGTDVLAFTTRLRDLAILVPLGLIGAWAVARWAPSARLVRAAILVSGVLLLGTLIVGLRLDDGPWPQDFADHDYVPSPVLRQILTITGSIGLFGVVAGFALWRRQAENERIATTSS